MIILQKRSDQKLDHYMDYTTWLDARSTTISTSTWTDATGDLTLANDALDGDSKIASVNISGGTVGETYKVINTVVTANGLTYGDQIYLYVY